MSAPGRLSTAQCVMLASLMEVTAPKPGNVYRGADFEDLTYPDFLVAAIAIAPLLEQAAERGLGETVLAAVEATHRTVGTNVNLGMILLLTPLAMVGREQQLAAGVRQVLARLTPADARNVYAAIRLARPGGLGRVETADVAGEAPDDLIEAMRLAAPRDLVARQYVEGFPHVFEFVVPRLTAALRAGSTVSEAIVNTHLALMHEVPDSLIARKCGAKVAEDSAARAGKVLDTGKWGDAAFHEELGDFDFWLRSDGHRRNPGTTADIIAAGLFALLRDDIIEMPFRLA